MGNTSTPLTNINQMTEKANDNDGNDEVAADPSEEGHAD